MSKNGASASPTERFASKGTGLSPRQSLLRRLTTPAPVSSTSTPFLKSSATPPTSKGTAEKHAQRSQQMPSIDERRRKQQSQPKAVSRLESVRLTLVASVSRRRARSTSEIPSKKQQQPQQHQHQKKIMLPPANSSSYSTAKKANGSNNIDPRNGSGGSGGGSSGSRIGANSNIEGDRLSLYAPSSTPRHFLLRRRPLSQFGGLARIVEDDSTFGWRQGTSTATTLSSDQCSTRSNSTRSSSSSSIRTVSENNSGGSIINNNSTSKNGAAAVYTTTTNSSPINNSKLLLKAPQKLITANDPNKQPWEPPADAPAPPTPIVSFSSSLYPTRLRGIIKSPTAPDTIPTLLRPSTSMVAVHPTSALFTTPPNAQKKEDRAISVWRNTVSQLMSETSSMTIGINNGGSSESVFPSIDSRKDRMSLCKFIMNELFTTEQSYQALLTLIQTRYMEPMMAVANNPLVKESDIAVLFRHLPEMIGLSNKLVSCLEGHAASLWRDFCPGQIAEIFDTIEDDLAVFLKYAVHYQANLKSIRRACNNVLFIKIEQESLARRDTKRMGISDYLIAPFQRVPRYCLLVKDLIKHTDRADPHQFARLHATLKLLTGLTMTMDHVQKISR